MISARTLQVWAEDDAAWERAWAERLQARAEYQRRYEATFDALATMSPARRQAVQRQLHRLNKVGCRSGSLEFIQALEWLTACGIPGANLIFEHDREHLAALWRDKSPAVATAAE